MQEKKDTQLDNICNNELLHTSISYVLHRLREVLTNSYGPNGANTIINGNGGSPLVTKDGLAILKKIRFNDSLHMNIHALIRDISETLVSRVGDGSTSAIIVASHLYDKLYPYFAEGIFTSREIRNELLHIQKEMEKNILNSESLFKPFNTLSDDQKLNVLTSVASLSNNNDENFGKEIAKIIFEYGLHTNGENISFDISAYENAKDIDHRFENGFKYKKVTPESGYIFRNNSSQIEVIAPLIVSSHFLTIERFNQLVSLIDNDTSNRLKIVIVASQVDTEVTKAFIARAMTLMNSTKDLGIYILNNNGVVTDNDIDMFTDFSIYCNSNPEKELIPESELKDYAGFAKKVIINRRDGAIFENGAGFTNGTPEYTNILAEIQKELDSTNHVQRAKRGNLRNRMVRLTGGVVTILVGGRTENEKVSNRELVEDSVLACRSVMNSGVSLGGNVTPLYSALISKNKCSSCDRKDMLTLILDAYIESYRTGCEDAPYDFDTHIVYNRNTNSSENIENTSVLAPVKTDIEIMNTAFSIITLLLTSNQFIV